MARGSWGQGWRRIDQITTDDEVLSRDENDPTGPLVWKKVEEVFERWGNVHDLKVAGRTIGTTLEHPFFALDKGWTPTGQLASGDRISGMDPRESVAVQGVSEAGRYTKVYNLRVADYRTYFVGGEKWGFSVWSHNTCTVLEATAARHEAYSKDLNQINRSLSRLGARALREAGGNTTNGWQSEALLRRYSLAVENRLRRTNSPYILLAEPAAMPGTNQRVPTLPNMSKPVNPYDGFPAVRSMVGSRRLDIGVARITPGTPEGLYPIVSGFDISHKPTSVKFPVIQYYQEAFGRIPIFDIRL